VARSEAARRKESGMAGSGRDDADESLDQAAFTELWTRLRADSHFDDVQVEALERVVMDSEQFTAADLEKSLGEGATSASS